MKKKKPSIPKTKEAAERVKRHQFGQPEANPSGNPSTAVSQREFYRWVESKASEDELRAFIADKSKPFGQRHFAELYMRNKDLRSMMELTTQVHGQPKQPIEVQDLPPINVHAFGEDNI